MKTFKRTLLHLMKLSVNSRIRSRAGGLTLLMVCAGTHSFAVLSTHTWQESHRGYSIELVPGTGGTTGTKAEYVAAGTLYDANRPSQTGWHFMQLDENGVVMASRVAWSVGGLQQFRVVDIAAVSQKEYRIIIQGKSLTRDNRDYIYIHGVDKNGNDLTGLAPNPDITLWSDDPVYNNIYPTHSLYTSEGLFICGYAARGPVDMMSLSPDNNFTDKLGMIMKVDIHSPSVTHTQYFWNSRGGSYTDYDMALRLAPYSYYSTFPLLITGAMNEGTNVSAAFVGKVDKNGYMIGMNGIEYTYPTSEPNQVKGIYGIDIRGQVGNEGSGHEGGDIVVLTNVFDETPSGGPWGGGPQPYEKNWGVMRIKGDLTSYPVNMWTFRYMSEKKGWANQFLELHYTNNKGDHIPVVGQQIDMYSYPNTPQCTALPAGNLPPSTVNVNPFITEVRLNDDWNPTTGYSPSYTAGPIVHRNLYLSSVGTKALNLDYLQGSLFYGAAIEDVSRLFTFASLGRYYDNPDVSNPPIPLPAMVLPIGEDPVVGSPDLRTKFLGISNSLYEESNCMQHVKNTCANYLHQLAGTYDVGRNFQSYDHKGVSYHTGYSIFTLEGLPYLPVNIDCSTGYYKVAGNTSITDRSIKLYPNPVSSELNIQLPAALKAGDSFEFVLSDISGKKVFRNTDNYSGSALVHIILPSIAPGMYVAEVNVNGEKSIMKITVK